LNDASGSGSRGLSRRALLGRAGGLALTAGAAAGIAGCENTTTPVSVAGAGGGGRGILGDPTAGGPVDASGIPLARRDYPVTLPRVNDSVKSSAKPEKGGELRIYNYSDYLNPAVLKQFGKQEGVEVKVTTFDTLDEAFSKLSTGRLQFDVIFTSPDQLSRLVGRKLVQPLNFELIGNLVKNAWPELHSPFYDVGPRYSVPYTVYTTGIGWRNDHVDFDPTKLENPWEEFWKAGAYRGRVGILDDVREALGMSLMRRGVADINTEKQDQLDQATKDLQDLDKRLRVKVTISQYETLPAGRMWLHQAWSGDLIGGVISYLPKGTPPTVLSYWFQPTGGPIFNDCICVAANAEKPVIAHRFLNFLLDNDVAYNNFVGYVGYQPPITAIDADKLFADEVLPKNLANTVVRHEDYANGNAYLTLSATGQRLWDRSWATFRNG
jgi:spermidine/putrescine transport system substrate-binding protein